MITRTLTCTLTPKEIEDRGRSLSQQTAAYFAEEARKSEANKAFKKTIDAHKSEMERLSKIVNEGREERPVNCEWQPYPSTETMRLVRIDTGEIVESRAMTAEERESFARQPPLPIKTPIAAPREVIAPEAPAEVRLLPEGREIAPEPPPEVRMLPVLEAPKEEGEEEDIVDADFEEVPPSVPTR